MTELRIYSVEGPAKRELWALFSPYHYLSETLNHSAHCWVVGWGDDLIAFTSSITMPSGTLRDAWREHRTVVLPDYQGLGIGAMLTDWVGQRHLNEGKRFYSRTTHPRLAAYRSRSLLWRETSKSGKQRKSWWSNAQSVDVSGKRSGTSSRRTWGADTTRLAWSFEYVGDPLVRALSHNRAT
jgi:GNAT superfamily N-acetyltransferase